MVTKGMIPLLTFYGSLGVFAKPEQFGLVEEWLKDTLPKDRDWGPIAIMANDFMPPDRAMFASLTDRGWETIQIVNIGRMREKELITPSTGGKEQS